MSLSGFQRRRRELAAQEAAAQEAAQAESVVKPYADMTKKELTAHAAANGIDLGIAKTNAEMIAVIEKHEKG